MESYSNTIDRDHSIEHSSSQTQSHLAQTTAMKLHYTQTLSPTQRLSNTSALSLGASYSHSTNSSPSASPKSYQQLRRRNSNSRDRPSKEQNVFGEERKYAGEEEKRGHDASLQEAVSESTPARRRSV